MSFSLFSSVRNSYDMAQKIMMQLREFKIFAKALGWTCEFNLIFLFNYPNQQTEMNCPESQF